MLDAKRRVAREGVEARAVEGARDGFEVARAAQPAIARSGIAQRARERIGVLDLGWPALDRAERGGERKEMEMVIVEARQQGAAGGLVTGLAGPRREVAADLADATGLAAQVEVLPRDLRPANQQARVQCSMRDASGAISSGALPADVRARGSAIACQDVPS